GRIGGEEFCILVYNCEHGAAEGLANRIRHRFATMEHEALGPDIRITASFGVTQWRSGEGYGKLFARADAALYNAKANGRNCVAGAENPATVDAQSRELPEPGRQEPVEFTGDRRAAGQS
ncbi:MAG: GGDEF domain-containing protein, partial [Erythrobacter sp.]|nr:GGDEF domain-containing protein [Erythrobacter sp.]